GAGGVGSPEAVGEGLDDLVCRLLLEKEKMEQVQAHGAVGEDRGHQRAASSGAAPAGAAEGALKTATRPDTPSEWIATRGATGPSPTRSFLAPPWKLWSLRWTLPVTVCASRSMPMPSGTRTRTLPETVLTRTVRGVPSRSRASSPVTEEAVASSMVPLAVTSPLTDSEARAPVWLRTMASPLTVSIPSRPLVSSTRIEPATVPACTSAPMPATRQSPTALL